MLEFIAEQYTSMANIYRYTPGKERGLNVNSPDLNAKQLAAARLDQGMVTMIDPANIPEGAMQLVKNAVTRFDKVSRRPGSELFTPSKPDSNPVLKLATLKKEDGNAYTVRFTHNSLYLLNPPGWDAITGTLSGTAFDRMLTAVVLDELVFANNGADPIQLVDLGAKTFADLDSGGGAHKKYRYVTGFFNRVIGAADAGTNEVEIGWSGDKNITVFDPAVDETAGSSPIVDSTSDLSDFITGVFGFTNEMIVMREKSVWKATKQAIPTQPFYFYSVVPGIGSDCPYSIVNIGQGLAWIDTRTRAVYVFTGESIEALSQPNEKNIFRNITDPTIVFGGFNPQEQEYTVYIPSVGSKTIQAWTYNFRNKTWSYQEYYDVYSANDTELARASTTIDDLLGTIDGLVGDIDSLSPLNTIVTVRSYGRGDGSIAVEDVNQPIDATHSDGASFSTYTTEIISKAFEAEEVGIDLLISDINIEYLMQQSGTFNLYYSRNGGVDWILAKTFKPTIIGKPRLLQYKKAIRCRRLAWKLEFDDGMFDILSYIVNVYPSGKSSNIPTL